MVSEGATESVLLPLFSVVPAFPVSVEGLLQAKNTTIKQAIQIDNKFFIALIF